MSLINDIYVATRGDAYVQFLLLLDEAGAEFTHGRINRKQMIAPIYNRVVRERPLAVKPIEVVQPHDKAGRAAGGFLLLGPLGAALGVMTSKGPAVRFELQFAEQVRQGIIAQRDYSKFRRKIEKMQDYRSGDLARVVLAWMGSAVLALLFSPIMGPAAILAGGGVAYAGHAIVKQRSRRAA